MPTLGERCDNIIEGLDTGEDPRADLENLREDLRLSGADAIEVVRDVDTDDGQAQPPVVSAFTPEGAEG